MKDDDKTLEIIIPNTNPSVNISPSLASQSDMRVAHRSTTHSVAPKVTSIVAPSWTDVLKRELSEDWTLRVLAALTILVLSLLVL